MGSLAISKEETNVLKAIAIITVIFSHSADMNLISYLHRDYFAWMCRGGMALFLFLSGYGLWLSYKCNGLEGYWSKKIDKIILPYLLTEMVLIIYKTVAGQNTLSIKDYFNIFLLSDPDSKLDASMWYLHFIFLWYFLFYICCKFIYQQKVIIEVILIASVAMIFFIPVYYVHADYLSVQFSLGLLYGEYISNRKLPTKKYIWIGIVGTVVLFIFFQSQFYGRTDGIGFLAGNIGSTMFVPVCIGALKLGHRRHEILEKIGELSFFMYLVEWGIIYEGKIYKLIGYNLGSLIINFLLIFGMAILVKKIYQILIQGWKVKTK